METPIVTSHERDRLPVLRFVQLADRFELSQLATRRLLTPPGETVTKVTDELPLCKRFSFPYKRSWTPLVHSHRLEQLVTMVRLIMCYHCY